MAYLDKIIPVNSSENQNHYVVFVRDNDVASDPRTSPSLRYNPSTKTFTIEGDTYLNGNVYMNGNNTVINSSTMNIDDKSIELGSIASQLISATGTVGTVSGSGTTGSPWVVNITNMTTTSGLIVDVALTATNGTGSFGNGSVTVSAILGATSITISSVGTIAPTSGTVTNITSAGASNLTANGGGLILKGATDKTLLWLSNNESWVSSEHFEMSANKNIIFNGSTSGSIILKSAAVAGSTELTLPSGTGTLAKTSDLHSRSHPITSALDHSATSWRLFYSDGTGQVSELALGSAGQIFQANGASAVPSWVSAYSHPTQLAITSDNSGGVVIQDISVNTGGHVTSIGTVDLDLRYQLKDADLAAIAALAGTSGFLKKTAADTWSLDTSSHLSGISANTWTGMNTITTLGTISTGTWSGTTISVSKGGTGITTYAIGDLIYASGTAALSALAGVATGNSLISGGVGTAPTWGKIGLTTHISGTLAAGNGGTGIASYAVGDIIYASGTTALSKLPDVATGNILLSGGVGVAPAWGKADLTSHVSNTLPATNGGTGFSGYTIGDIVYASSTTALSKLVSAASGNSLLSNGVGTAPSWGKIGLTTHVSGTLAAGNGGTGIASYAVGDIIYASGTTALSKLPDVATGNILLSGGVGVAPAWGKADLTSHVSNTLPATNGGTGFSGYTIGDILFASSTTALSKLASAVAGNVLLTNGTGSAPSWGKVSATSHISGTLGVANGGTGVATLTDHGVLIGSGTGAVTSLGVATNGQLLIGSTGNDPVLATLSAGQGIKITNGAGSIVITQSESVITKASAYTLTIDDSIILCDASAGAFTLTLPAASTANGVVYRIKKIDTTFNAITIDANGTELIEGQATTTLPFPSNAIDLVCNGTAWYAL